MRFSNTEKHLGKQTENYRKAVVYEISQKAQTLEGNVEDNKQISE